MSDYFGCGLGGYLGKERAMRGSWGTMKDMTSSSITLELTCYMREKQDELDGCQKVETLNIMLCLTSLRSH